MWAVGAVAVLTLTGCVAVRQQQRAIDSLHVQAKRQIAAEKRATAKKGKVAGAATTVAPIDCVAQPCLALTFDDGPNPITTPQVLDILERQQVHASFFVVGSRVSGNEALLKRMFTDGDEIGNHSWSHPDFTTLTPAQITEQIDKTQAAITATGIPAPALFRPPYGKMNATAAASVSLSIMYWNEDPRDWAANSPAQVQNALLSAARPGGVVEMHDIYHVTVNALEPTIQALKQQRYQLVTVSQLLNIQPGQKGEFYGRPAP